MNQSNRLDRISPRLPIQPDPRMALASFNDMGLMEKKFRAGTTGIWFRLKGK